ncbi:MAG: leucyl aminopeptidase [Nanoarchaeota archaeon]|nr:leucyl aminopeptidase [Nanoarchaeota archaeon]
MKINLKRGSSEISKGEMFILLTEEETKKIRSSPKHPHQKEFASRITNGQFSGEEEQRATLHLRDLRLHTFGLGKEKELSKETLRKTASLIADYCLCLRIPDINILLNIPKISPKDSAEAILDGILLGSYRFDKYKEKDEKIVKLKSVTFHTTSKEKNIEESLRNSEITCNAANYVRDLQTENADVATPLYLEKHAREIAKKYRLKIKVLDEKELKKIGAGLILAVAKGSRYPPRMIILEYNGNPKSKDKTAIVGKGITFDSGGLNIKPTGHMETMKEDMSGSAVCLGTIKAAAELKLKSNLIAVLSSAENAIGSASYKPGDVVTSLSGKTVEIGNTDAEGRLVLADALTYIEKNLKPARIIDIATLTGAVIIALGDYTAGMCGTDKETMKKLFRSGESTYERVWELPLHKEYISEVKSDIADMNNINYSRKAGAIMGAAFLSKFVENTPWVHIDIAGTSWLDNGPRYYYQKGATGYGVRLLIDFLKNN